MAFEIEFDPEAVKDLKNWIVLSSNACMDQRESIGLLQSMMVPGQQAAGVQKTLRPTPGTALWKKRSNYTIRACRAV